MMNDQLDAFPRRVLRHAWSTVCGRSCPNIGDAASGIWVRIVFCLAFLLSWVVQVDQSWAVVVATTMGNTTAPGNDPGWLNVAENGSVVYLGDSWVITAAHAYAGQLDSYTLTFDGIDYQGIKGTRHNVANPNYQALDLAEDSDIQMFRINGKPDLDSVSIAAQTTPVGGAVTMIGVGTNVPADPGDSTKPRIDEYYANTSTWQWDYNCTSGCNFSGFLPQTALGRTKRWGTNNVINPEAETGLDGNVLDAYEAYDPNGDGIQDNFEYVDSEHFAYFPVGSRHSILWRAGLDFIGMMVKFDEGVTNEGVASGGDSGGPLFYERNGEWELAGLMHAPLGYPAQNNQYLYEVFGNWTVVSNLAFYKDYVETIMADNQAYSIMGDVNLDGEVSGDGNGDPATDDVAAFVDGWLYEQAEGDIISWQKGDLSLDGKTDFADFLLMREAMGGTLSSGQFASLLGVASIPEPASVLSALCGFAFLCLWRRKWRGS